jgi:hypothetical protein
MAETFDLTKERKQPSRIFLGQKTKSFRATCADFSDSL